MCYLMWMNFQKFDFLLCPVKYNNTVHKTVTHISLFLLQIEQGFPKDNTKFVP